MPNSIASIPPDANVLEISLFGPGVGECVLVHLGGGDWLIVDSLQRRPNLLPVALEYLGFLGVEPSGIRVIVATHWDDDHVRGLFQVLQAAPNADFYCSAAFGNRDVRVMLDLYGGVPPKQGTTAREVWEVFQLLEERGKPLKLVGPNQILYRRAATREIPDVIVSSLSPSHSAVQAAIQAMISRIPHNGDLRVFRPWRPPNHNAIVLSVKWDTSIVLLGADLEEVNNAIGWTAIVNDLNRDQGRAEVFKVPHHGSMNAFVDRAWDELLVDDPIAIVAPFRQGDVILPTAEGREAICRRSSRAFIASFPYRRPAETTRERAVQRTLAEASISVQHRTYPSGQVRLRKSAQTSNDEWAITLMGNARELCA
jgi:hypothetical protein